MGVAEVVCGPARISPECCVAHPPLGTGNFRSEIGTFVMAIGNSQIRESSSVVEVAERVVEDIRLRRMTPGERYLTSDEARRVFGVGKGIMDRALRLLSEHDVLVRRQKSGTFVGPSAPVREAVQVCTLHVFMIEVAKALTDFPFDSMITGLRREVPGANVQFNIVPKNAGSAGLEYAREVINGAKASGHFGGVLSIRCPRDMSQFFVDSGVPLVAFGAFYCRGPTVPCVDVNRRDAGRLLTEYVVKKGHKRIALLNVATGQPGDNNFYDGVSEVLTAVRFPHNALILRALPADIEIVPMVVRELLEKVDRPTAFIVLSERVANVVADTAAQVGLAVPNDLEVAFWDVATVRVRRSPYPHVQTQLAFEDIAALVGSMFRDLLAGRPPEQKKISIPVEFRGPRAKDTQ